MGTRPPPLPRQTTHSEASQGPLPLDKPDQLPPTLLQGRKGESAVWNAQAQAPSLPPPSLGPPSPAWPHRNAGGTQEPLRLEGGSLGNAWRAEGSSVSLRQPSRGKRRDSDASLLSSGYSGDEESSEVSLAGRRPRVRQRRSLKTQTHSAQTSQPAATHCPSQIRSPLVGQAPGAEQTGGEK
ncbi:protein TNT [Suricata suricatta]|uniref:protein TNT n=1 Tax=Suricata suricatta TaxID=37032 RepID=UPI001155AD21|nr:protein TNT [Suricata suricatta]